jgi:S1-C subfamily serine protease
MPDVKTLCACAAVAVVVSAATTTILVARRGAANAAAVPASPSEPKPPASTGQAATTTTTTTKAGTWIDGDVADARDASKTFSFEIADDAVQADIALTSESGDVEFRASCGAEPPERGESWPWRSRAEDDRAKLSLTRHADREFRPGKLFVDVRPTSGAGRRDEKSTLTFRLRVDVAKLVAPTTIAPGAEVDASTSPDDGHRRDFVVDVPAGAKALRVDLVEAERDLDVLLSSKGPALDRDAAEWSAATLLCRESFVFSGEADAKPPAGGKLWFSVVDPSVYDAPVKFRVVVTLGADAPAEALKLPEIPVPSDPRERAVAAVVELIVDDGTGSGTIVSGDGLILTARHVIGERTGERKPIFVALDLDPTRTTRELFRAKVVKSDEGLDLALLRITSGRYDQPLPPGLRFPACPVAFDAAPRLGDPLVTIGFPEPAGTGSRAPVMYSQGVVSGFEREKSGVRIKTDAFVASGSSGGAALDAQFRLVGVPVFVVGETEGTAQTGFLVPVSELPREWREMISAK